jgi:ribosome biogenesis protein MAK21
VRLDQAASDDDEEERFIDVDKVITQAPKADEKVTVKRGSEKYDPHKREPKYAHAENALLWELTALCRHTHPTVRLWSKSILDGGSVSYNGDPLLDFSLANFYDRIAYKEPKSSDKLAKFQERQRMSVYTKPLNQIDFKAGEQPEDQREEEQFMYKYLEEQQKTKKAVVDEEDSEGLEAFADAEIRKEMARLQSGAGVKPEDEDEEDVDVSYSDDDGMDAGSDDFFGGEANLKEMNQDGEGSEEEMSGSDIDMAGDAGSDYGGEYGDEYDQEIEEEEASTSAKKKGGKKDKDASVFASSEDFAHLLEEGAEKEKTYETKKRNFSSFEWS